MPDATWRPHEKHGQLTKQSDLPDSVYAFPKQRKEPLTDAQHVRNAVARFDQVIDVSDADRALAFANIEKAARYYDVNLAETSWHDLGIHPQENRREAAAKGDVTRERRLQSEEHQSKSRPPEEVIGTSAVKSQPTRGTLNRRQNMTDTNAVIAVYDNHSAAEDAVKELQKSGFDMKKLSVVGKDYHTEEQVVGYYNAGDRMKYWGKWGAFWGGFWGLLFGAAFFWVPAIGPVLVGGPLVAWIVAGLEDAVVVGGLSAIGAGLFSIGIPKDSIITYETAIRAGKYLVIAHGTSAEAATARNVLGRLKATDVTDHILDPAVQAVTR